MERPEGYTEADLESELDDLLAAKGKEADDGNAAASCGTRGDFDRWHKQKSKVEDHRAFFLHRWAGFHDANEAEQVDQIELAARGGVPSSTLPNLRLRPPGSAGMLLVYDCPFCGTEVGVDTGEVRSAEKDPACARCRAKHHGTTVNDVAMRAADGEVLRGPAASVKPKHFGFPMTLPRLRWQSRGEDFSELRPVRNGEKGEVWCVQGSIHRLQGRKVGVYVRGTLMATIAYQSGALTVAWDAAKEVCRAMTVAAQLEALARE